MNVLSLQALVHVLIMASTLTAAQFLLKSAAVSAGELSFVDHALKNITPIVAALSLYGATFFYYFWVLKSLPLSWVYPIYTATSIVFVLLVGKVFFGEHVDQQQLFGVALIVLGVVVTGLK